MKYEFAKYFNEKSDGVLMNNSPSNIRGPSYYPFILLNPFILGDLLNQYCLDLSYFKR